MNKVKENTETKIDPLKRDLGGAVIIGVLASIFAFIVVANLGLEIPWVILFLGFTGLTIVGIFVTRFLGAKIPLIYKFGKFGEAGGLNWLTDFGILNLFIMLTGINGGVYFSVFKGVSFVGASTNSYFWNKFWVFEKGKTKKVGAELTKFAVSVILGMVVNVIIASAIRFLGPNLYAGIDGNLWANIAAAIGSLTAMVFNFAMFKLWVFK